MQKILEILLPVNLTHGFDYLVPDGLEIPEGALVRVPFGKSEAIGVVWGAGKSGLPLEKIRPILEYYSHLPPISKVMREFISWVAWYHCVAEGLILKMALSAPDAIPLPKRIPKTVPSIEFAPASKPKLNPQQAEIAAELVSQIGKGFRPSLLEGVTGSGKTETYFEAMEVALAQNQQVLVLLPEISLSLQWVKRCEARFGELVTVWHSGLTAAQRKKNWRSIINGEARISVGARSALFLPFKNLGLLVVDEEHEASYKQEDGVPYHARDMAVVRARSENIPVILASATPALETLENVRTGKYLHLQLDSRFGVAELPEIKLVDMRKEKLSATNWVSAGLCQALQQNLEQGKQAVLFLNRRGYAPLLLCRTCGYRFACVDCSAWLVLHGKHQLCCHHCGHTEKVPPACPSCGKENCFAACGPGVERLAEEVGAIFPNARVLTLTSDHAATRAELEVAIDQIIAGAVDIIIGTQMLAKGHHFPLLTLVGVIDADMGLQGGDPRAAERTWQMLHQVAGRAGREADKGTVLIQTWQPEHSVMQALLLGDGKKLLELERDARKESLMPPFGRLVSLLIEAKSEIEALAMARKLAACAPRMNEVSVLGPAPAALSRLRGKYRYRLLLKAEKQVNIQNLVGQWLKQAAVSRNVRIKLDVDPYSFM